MLAFLLAICLTFFFVGMFVTGLILLFKEHDIRYLILLIVFLFFSVALICSFASGEISCACPGCGCLWLGFWPPDYCSACGYELIPHCIDCGKVCRTAFCALCGAEQ